MILLLIFAVPLIGAMIAPFIRPLGREAPRRWALLMMTLDFAALIPLWGAAAKSSGEPGAIPIEINLPWFPQFGIGFHVYADGLSIIMVTLTVFLGLVSVAFSRREIHRLHGWYYCFLLLTLCAMIGVFIARDLFLFYFMWELMLVPMFFIIAIWGYGRRIRAAGLFMLFSQSGGLLMLLSIAALYFSSGLATGHFTFDYNALLRSTQDGGSAWWLMLGFFAAFAIKMGIVPFHAWVREAYAEAPISGAMVLSGIMTKTAVYGLLRFAQPLFPPVAASFSRIAMIIGVVTLLYGAAMAFAQTELRRMIAYVSISAMGLLLLGAYGGNDACREGTVVMMVSHGITLAALFMIAGILMDRLGGTEFSRLGGLWSVAPRLGGAALVFSLAAMSLPGMGTFVGEALVLFGVFQVSPPLAAAGTLSIVFSVMFATQLIGRVFHGESKLPYSWRDLTGGELGGLAVMIVLIIGIGLYPRPLLVVKTPAAESGIEQGQTVRKTPAIKDTSVITGMP